MRAQLRSEFLKQRSTRTVLGLVATMVGLVLLVTLLHAFSLSRTDLASRSGQLRVLVEGGEVVGALFAGLLGAMSVTGEFRHGTIRPTFLVTPRRGRVVAAKTVASTLTGFVLGLMATAVAAAAGTLALAARGVTVQLDSGNYVLLLVGGAAAAALWAVIGLGLGAIVSNQVATVVGLVVWLVFIENLLVDSLPGVSRYAPGVLGRAIIGQQTGTLHTPALAALLLILYAGAAAATGGLAITRRDVD
jgi:ABC-type transport system involved in multi-copper enzyme maturation permease subunit